MLNPNDIHVGMRVLDSDADFIGTVIDAGSDYVRMRSDGKVDGQHDVPLSRFSRMSDDAVYLDGPWATVLTSVETFAADTGDVIKGAAAAIGGMASSAAHSASHIGDDIKQAASRDHSTTENTGGNIGASTSGSAGHEPGTDGSSTIWPWILFIGAAIAAILAFRSCTTTEAEAPVAPPVAENSALAPSAAAQRVTLPDNAQIEIMPGTITYDLYTFVSGTEAAPKTFTFDRLNFDTGSAAIRAEDQPTIDSIAVIMKAYPNVSGEIVGYTDATGNAADNEKLSADRSTNVMNAIIAKNIAASRLSSRAGGVADTLAGADQNARRTDLIILSK